MKKPKIEDFSKFPSNHDGFFLEADRNYWQWRAGVAGKALETILFAEESEGNLMLATAEKALKLIEESQQ